MGKSILGRRNNLCKNFKVGVCLGSLGKGEEVIGVGFE